MDNKRLLDSLKLWTKPNRWACAKKYGELSHEHAERASDLALFLDECRRTHQPQHVVDGFQSAFESHARERDCYAECLEIMWEELASMQAEIETYYPHLRELFPVDFHRAPRENARDMRILRYGLLANATPFKRGKDGPSEEEIETGRRVLQQYPWVKNKEGFRKACRLPKGNPTLPGRNDKLNRIYGILTETTKRSAPSPSSPGRE